MPNYSIILVAAVLAGTAALALWFYARARRARDLVAAENHVLRHRMKRVLDADVEAKRILDEAARREAVAREAAAALESRARQEAMQLESSARAAADAHEARAREAAIHLESSARDAADAHEARARAEATRLETSARDAADVSERRRASAERQAVEIEAQLKVLREEFNALDEQANLQSFGFYKPQYGYDTSELYKREEDRVRAAQAAMIKAGTAAVCDTEWHMGGSKVEGRKMVNQTLRLMLRAFNGECDAAVARVKYNNVGVMITRIRKAAEAVNKAASVQQCRISDEYLRLKLAELQVTHEYQEKLQEEKEEQRRIREQMREEEIARRELEKAQADAEKEEKRYADALEKARAEVEGVAGAKQDKLRAQIAELEKRIAEAHERKERAIARAQLTRSGHVYVISNIGSFGEHVYKIGMTRRLDPLDRIKELGDASVPFQFDVHAIIYTDDAPRLENTLHRLFTHRRLNRVNERKEFFHVTLDEISDAVRANHGEIELTQLAEAEEFRKTLAVLNDEIARQSGALTFAIPPHWQLAPAISVTA